jgi:hypothetical protein
MSQVVLPGTEIWGDFRLPGRQSASRRDAGGPHHEGWRWSAWIRVSFISTFSLPDLVDWETFEKARQAIQQNLSRAGPAARYRAN